MNGDVAMPRRFVLAFLLLLLGVGAAARASEPAPVLAWGDQGDGTYRNPVLKADYSDPDVIRVGDDFYLVASDFHFVGMQVLHSRDLVNWEVVGQVFPRLDVHPKYDEMNGYAQGTWAPTLRYHDGQFYVFVCTPYDGLFMWHAANPRGPWSETVTVKAVSGWEDPAPFWDDDGRAYLVHSVLGAGPLILHEMSPDGRRLLDDGVEIYRGNVAEGPKLFKRRGWYYISLPEGGVETGGQTVLRAKALLGPWERREVLVGGSPHQGGLVDLPNGESWFLGFKSTGHLGRVVHLLPVKWGEDGWPVFGDDGRTVDRGKKPGVGKAQPIARPATSDEFDGPGLSPQWQWNHNPVPEAWSLAVRPGWLRLEARPASDIGRARNTLTQKLWDDAGVFEARFDTSGMADGQRAGVTFISGSAFGWVGVAMRGGKRRIGWEQGEGPELSGDVVVLRGRYSGSAAHLEYSLDGRTFADTGVAFNLAFGHWKGARVGVFNYGRRGHVDLDSVRYRYGAPEDLTRSLLAAPSGKVAVGPEVLPFRNPDLPDEERITDLLSRMTLEEKIDALAVRTSVPRLGVVGSPHIEGYHGVAQGGPSNWGQRNPTPTTQFPQAYGLGATWDPDLVRRVAAQEAYEARYLFQSRKYDRSGLIVRAPNADLARDPRWGRTEEVYGEDPFLVGALATAFTRGLQGDDPRYWKTAALLKHFLANSNENGRSSSSSDFDERLWREYYAWPFERAVRDGGSRALMAAYNAVNGTPAHVHPMLRQIVMGEWGVDGIVCTDGGGLRLLVSDHKAFPDLPAAAAACLKAGINFFLDRHKEAVAEALSRGLVTEADLDAALRGNFRVSLRLGLLDPPEGVPYARIGASDDPEPWAQPETRALVREVTRKSIVLLKNSAGLLPLDRAKVRSVAVVGPLANTVLLDWYSGTPPYAVSPRQGIERVANPPGPPGPNRVGVTWVGDMGETALQAARGKDAVVVCVGNHPEGNAGWELVSSPSEGKEAVDRREIVLPPDQEGFVRRLYAVNPNTIVVLVASFPYALPWAAENATTILQMTHASQELGTALGDVLFGDWNPGGKTTQTWPRSLDQLPPMMDYDIRHGRTYMYFRGEPQFPFGHGLSYTSFAFANLAASRPSIRLGGALSVSVDVTNTGARDGDEVVQMYGRFVGSKIERPSKKLLGFARVTVAAGQTRRVEIPLRGADLAYWDAGRHAWALERAKLELMVGGSSAEAALTQRLVVEATP
jgi:beta-glucosidase